MSCNVELSPNNSIVFEHQVTNPLASPIYVNNATVTIDIQDNSGASITDFPASLFYVTDSDGIYRNTFTNLDVTPGQTYLMVINATTPDPLEFSCSKRVKAGNRDC